MNDSNIYSLLKNAVYIHKNRYFESPYIESSEFGYKLIDKIASFVLDERDRIDEYFLKALEEHMERQKIGTAIIFDKAYVKRLVERCEERTVIPVDARIYKCYGCCPQCGADLYPTFNKDYCGACGQKISWEAKKEEVQDDG